jgi:hypothetical protein
VKILLFLNLKVIMQLELVRHTLQKKTCYEMWKGTTWYREESLNSFVQQRVKIECKKKARSPLLPAGVERGPCENSDSFQFTGNSSRTCDSYFAIKTEQEM